jgi:hypothetical protein
MRVAQYKDVTVNARYDSGVFKGYDVMVLSDRSYAPRGLDEYLSRDQIDGLATILAAAAESIIRATEDAARA